MPGSSAASSDASETGTTRSANSTNGRMTDPQCASRPAADQLAASLRRAQEAIDPVRCAASRQKTSARLAVTRSKARTRSRSIKQLSHQELHEEDRSLPHGLLHASSVYALLLISITMHDGMPFASSPCSELELAGRPTPSESLNSMQYRIAEHVIFAPTESRLSCSPGLRDSSGAPQSAQTMLCKTRFSPSIQSRLSRLIVLIC
jgi:hypothetical protein